MSSPEVLLLIGASVRPAAFSALRAGLRPMAIDLFADRDLAAVCPTRRVPPGRYPDGLVELAREAPPGPWMYTGALENRPAVVERIASDRPLWGNDASCLARIRDPFALAEAFRAVGLPCLEVRRAGEAPAGRWLVKPVASAGGAGIRVARPESSKGVFGEPRPSKIRGVPPASESVYLQEFINGEPQAGLFVADGAQCTLLGVTRQLVGERWLHARPFRYSGSIGPLEPGAAERAAWERLGAVVTAFAGLRGLFGIDAVLRDGVPWPVEVNPRYTASVEVIEYATGVRAVDDHREVFGGAVSPSRKRKRRGFEEPSLTLPARKNRVVGKAVWYAPRPVTVPADGPWEEVLRGRPDFDVPPAFADVPAAGDHIASGRPVLTAFAVGDSVEDCERRLRTVAAELDAILLR